MAWTKATKDLSLAEYLLQEIGDFLLMEDGGYIISAGAEGTGWNKEAKELSA